MEFSWKPAQQSEREFIIEKEYDIYIGAVFGICLICGTILVLIYIFVHMSAAASYEQIRNNVKRRNHQYEQSKMADVDLMPGADSYIASDGSMQPMNTYLELKSKERYFFFSYLFFFVLCAGVSLWFIYDHYKEYNAFRKSNIDVCYGRCVGKEYVRLRYNSRFSVNLFLPNGTLIENIPVTEPVCRNVKPGDILLLSNISGPCQGPDKSDEIDGIYLLEKQGSPE